MTKLVANIYTRKDVEKYAFDGLIDAVEMLTRKSGKPREHFLDLFKNRDKACVAFIENHVKVYLNNLVDMMNQIERESVEHLNKKHNF